MAKINHFIASYSDAISDLDISFEGTETNPPKVVIQRFVRVFKDISDSRVQAMIEYPLVEIILIAFLAVRRRIYMATNGRLWKNQEKVVEKVYPVKKMAFLLTIRSAECSLLWIRKKSSRQP